MQFLRPFPLVARRLLEVIDEEGMHLRELSRLLTRDAAFSGQVLQVANSALLGLRYEVTSIQRALSALGLQRLRALVVTVAMKNYMGRGGTAAFGGCWRHNLGTALWCEVLADCCNVEKAVGYTGGLLHDIGRLALLMLFPKDYALLTRNSAGKTADNLEAERRFCDVDHCQMGYYLAESWNFPTGLCNVIAHHHDTPGPETPRLQLLVQTACIAANMSGFHAAGKGCAWDPGRMTDLLPPANARLLPSGEVMRKRVASAFNEIELGLV